VTYLLDVNVLLAMRYVHHVHHDRTICWLRNLETGGASARFASCSITELGFVRIAGNRNSGLAARVAAAQEDLLRLKEDLPFIFLTDPLGADHSPLWVDRYRQVTDGHLLALAKVNGIKCAPQGP
jgi:predicted nucleic acid-binding protein